MSGNYQPTKKAWVLPQAELQQQLADCTSTNWEGFHIMQLKIQALVSWLCT